MGNVSNKMDTRKDGECFLNYLKIYKENHPALNEEELKGFCKLKWNEMEPREKILFQGRCNSKLAYEETEESLQAPKAKAVKRRSLQWKKCAASQQIKKKPYCRPLSLQKKKPTAAKGRGICNRSSIFNNGYLNYMRNMQQTNSDMDSNSFAKECFQSWSKLSQAQKTQYRKKVKF